MKNSETANWRKRLFFSATFLLSILVVFSCKKKENPLGESVINQNGVLSSGGVDTFTLETFSYFDDSVVSDNAPFALLGSYNDPVFGTYNAEVYTQVRLSGNAPNFGNLDSIVIDSLILGLEYIGSYVDAGIQNVEVYEIGEDLFIDSTYYSFESKTHATGTDLVVAGMGALNFDLDEITVIDLDTVDTQLRIPLDTNLAWSLINESATGNGNFLDNDAFVNYFKGLHILTNNSFQSSGTGGVFYFNLTDPLSKLTIYYRFNGVPKTFDFVINSSVADFNHIDINNTATQVETVINDTISGQSEFYSQAFGSRAVVRFDGINNIPKTAVIHSATLELPVSFQTGSNYTPGITLSVTTILNDGTSQLFSVNAFGNYSDFSKKFTVDLRQYIQAVVNGDIENTGLIFSPILHSTSAERIIFNGSESNNKDKPKLSILYTEF